VAGFEISPRGRLVLNLAYAAILLVLGLIPRVPGLGTAVPDALAHATAAGTQALMLFWLLVTASSPPVAVISSGFAAFVFGGVIEVLQLLQPARYFQAADLAANAVGATLVCIMIALVLARRKNRAEPTP